MQWPSFSNVDLFAAAINALNGALVALSPRRDRNFTFVDVLIMAFIGGVGGGVTRDVLLNDLPGPLVHASFLIACLAMGLVGIALYTYANRRGEHFRKNTLALVKSFTLPWFAVLGAHKALDHDCGVIAAVVVGVIATTAGGVVIDLICGVTPEIVERAEHLVTTAILAATVYAVLATVTHGSLATFYITLIAVAVAFVFRLIAVRTHWEEIVPKPHGDEPDVQSPA